MLLKEVRTLRWCKPRVTQGVVSFPSDRPRVEWWMMVHEVNGDWFLFYWGYTLLDVMVVGFEKNVSFTDSGRWNVPRVVPRLVVGYKHLLTLSWQRPVSYRNQSIDLQSKTIDWFLYDNGLRHERVKVRKLTSDSSMVVTIASFQSADPSLISWCGSFATLLLSWNLFSKPMGA